MPNDFLKLSWSGIRSERDRSDAFLLKKKSPPNGEKQEDENVAPS
jgi:hypothetical protein